MTAALSSTGCSNELRSIRAPPGTGELVSKAQDGDLAALGQLYGITAALLSSPSSPEPLRSFMPDLLQNLSADLKSTPKGW